MIVSFADKETAKVFSGEVSRKLPRDIQSSSLRKLIIIDMTEDILDLWKLPGLKPEKLTGGKRHGQWSIRINHQWRVCFYWQPTPPEASGVEVCDYH